LSSNKIGAAPPGLLEPLPSSSKIFCVHLAWDELDANVKPAAFNARWLKSHRTAQEARITNYLAASVPLPRARCLFWGRPDHLDRA